MVKRLITKAAFAREAKISRAGVGKLCNCKPEGKLYPAMDGKLIDIDHPKVIEYLESKQSPKTSKAVKNAKSTKTKAAKKNTVKSNETSKDKPGIEEPSEPKEEHYSKARDIQKVMDLPFREVLKEYGTDTKFQGWASGGKTISDTKWKDLQSAKLAETLIPRALVETHIFGAIENSNLRLLTDTPKTIARRLGALFKSGDTMQSAELLVRELLSTQLKNSKVTAKRLLSNGTSGT